MTPAARTERAPWASARRAARSARAAAWIGAALLALCAAGCSILPAPTDAEVTGVAYSRQRFFIPSGGTFEALLLDVTDEGAPPLIVGRQGFETFERLPVALHIPYRTALVAPDGKYVVRAVVSVNGIAWMASEGTHPLQRDPAYRHVDVPLLPLPRGAATAEAAVPLAQTYWRLMEIDGMPMPPTPAGRPEAHLVVLPDEGRLAGTGGCNRFIGAYEIAGSDLRVGPIDTGLQLCFDTGLAEGLYLEALRAVEHYRIEGRQLLLTRPGERGRERVLLRFEAPELRFAR